MLKRNLIPALLIALALGATGLNFAAAKIERPFFSKDTKFQIQDVVLSDDWVDSAPLLLARHFEQVDAVNVGSAHGAGISFNPMLVSIWKTGTVDDTKDPIDLSSRTDLDKLTALAQEQSKTYCGVTLIFCDALYIWDSNANFDRSIFVGVKIGLKKYALVEQGLLNKFLAGEL